MDIIITSRLVDRISYSHAGTCADRSAWLTYSHNRNISGQRSCFSRSLLILRGGWMYERRKINGRAISAIEWREQSIPFVDIECIIVHSINTIIRGVQRYLYSPSVFHFFFFLLQHTTLELGRVGIPPNGQNAFANGMHLLCNERSNSWDNFRNSRSLLLNAPITNINDYIGNY